MPPAPKAVRPLPGPRSVPGIYAGRCADGITISGWPTHPGGV